MNFKIKKVEIWEYETTQLYDDYLEELEEIINELEEYEHIEVGYSEEISEIDLKTYQGYYWE